MRYHHGEADADWWAIELRSSLEWWADEARVRDGLLRLVNAAESDEDLAIIGAGPLEVFVSDDESRVHGIERQGSGLAGVASGSGARLGLGASDKLLWRVERAAGSKLNDPCAEYGIRRRDQD